MIWLWLCVGAALGAPARYLTNLAVQAHHDSVMPWGTLTVNVVGSLILGLLVGVDVNHHVPPAVVAGVGTGFCGALTTYSTFSYETLRLVEDGAWFYATANTAMSLAAGIGAAVLGYSTGLVL